MPIHQKDRVLRGLQALILAVILGVIYWGNGNELNTIDPPIVQVIEEHKDEIAALKRTIAERDKTVAALKTQLKTAKYVVSQYERQLADVRHAMPTTASIQKAVMEAARTEEGMRRETKRVLGDLGITNIQVMP